MIAFYRDLHEMDKREALRKAQIKVKQTSPHPFYRRLSKSPGTQTS